MTTEYLPLGTQFAGLANLPGVPTPELLGTPLHRHLERWGDLSWASLALLTPAAIRQIKGVGAVRLARLVAEISRRVAAFNGGSATLAPASEEHTLSTINATHRADPVKDAERFLASLDSRQEAILDRLLTIGESAPTLEEIGRRFGVTRERIRQIEADVRTQLQLIEHDPAYTALAGAATQLRERLGSAVPLGSIIDEFASFPPDHLDRLLLRLAGPYVVLDEWVVLSELGGVARTVLRAFEAAADDGWVSVDALLEGLAREGIRCDFREAAIAACADLRTIDGAVVDWRGSVRAKASRLLALRGVPMSIDELVDVIGHDAKRNLTNQMAADPDFVLVGLKRYALASWDVATYRGIANEMAAVIEAADGPIDLAWLAAQLHDQFGASPNSVKILASSHPQFVVDNGNVMLRPADQPYQPKRTLEATESCQLVDGKWAWRIPVDHDVLRGSGRTMPEAFAAYLGVKPLSTTTINSPVGPIHLGWWQSPQIGSLRVAARSVGAEQGDHLLVISETPSMLSFRRLPAATPDTGDAHGADPTIG